MSRRLVALAAVVLLVATACGGDDGTAEPDGLPSPAVSPTPTGDATPSPTPPFTADTEPDEAEGSGEPILVTDVTVTREDGFDRVVLDTGGGGEAGWFARYVEEPSSAGSGHPVEVAGEASLQLTVTHSAMPPDAPEGVEPYDGPDRIEPDDTEVVREVVNDTIFEGQHDFFVGTTHEAAFRVRRGDGGTVVLEVLHDG